MKLGIPQTAIVVPEEAALSEADVMLLQLEILETSQLLSGAELELESLQLESTVLQDTLLAMSTSGVSSEDAHTQDEVEVAVEEIGAKIKKIVIKIWEFLKKLIKKAYKFLTAIDKALLKEIKRIEKIKVGSRGWDDKSSDLTYEISDNKLFEDYYGVCQRMLLDMLKNDKIYVNADGVQKFLDAKFDANTETVELKKGANVIEARISASKKLTDLLPLLTQYSNAIGKIKIENIKIEDGKDSDLTIAIEQIKLYIQSLISVTSKCILGNLNLLKHVVAVEAGKEDLDALEGETKKEDDPKEEPEEDKV